MTKLQSGNLDAKRGYMLKSFEVIESVDEAVSVFALRVLTDPNQPITMTRRELGGVQIGRGPFKWKKTKWTDLVFYDPTEDTASKMGILGARI